MLIAELPGGGYTSVGMDGAKFHDTRARQALQKAIDYEGFIKAFHPRGGRYAAPLSDLMPHYQQMSQAELRQWHRHDPQEARALWEAANFEIPIEKIRIYQVGAAQSAINEFLVRTLSDALGLEVAPEICQDWCAGAVVTDVKDWEILSFGSDASGGTTGIPHDSHLIQYDPRGNGYGFRAFNHSHLAETTQPEVIGDALTLTGMLDAQEQETDFDRRAVLLTEIQRWILDRAWCVLPLPVSKFQYFGFSSRLRDFGPDDWGNHYGLRRESMWLADA